MDLLYPSSHAEARSCPMYVPQDRSRPPGTGSVHSVYSVHPRNKNKLRKKKIICWVCNWLCLQLDNTIGSLYSTQREERLREIEGRNVTSTAALADGGLSEFFLVQRKK
jgi:hypothetical protein